MPVVDIIYCGNFMWTRLDGERSLCSGQVIVQQGRATDHLIKSQNSSNMSILWAEYRDRGEGGACWRTGLAG